MAKNQDQQRNTSAVRAFGQRMWDAFGDYKKDRRAKEEQMMKNLRQFNGEWDPEVEQGLLETQSRAYPRLTRRAVIGTVSRLMEMMFPQTEKNWGVAPSPMPELGLAETQEVLNALQAKRAGEGSTEPLTDQEIEGAIQEYAKTRAYRMETRMNDQLTEMDHISLSRQVVFSGVLYSYGVATGPHTKLIKRRTWKQENGTYKAIEITERSPYYVYVNPWDYYPDMSAKTMSQTEGFYLRHVMSSAGIEDLKALPDYDADEIASFLATHRSGNYVEEWWESELRSARVTDRANISNLNGRKYEMYEWWGTVHGADLIACGVKAEDGKLYEANIVGIDTFVFKAVITPYEAHARPDHVFIYEETDTSLLGAALPEAMRDSQMTVANAARMMVDNASAVCGPNLEINMDALDPDTDPTIHAFKTWQRNNDDIPANIPAVRNISFDSHIPELLQVIEKFTQFSEMETMMPPSALGQVEQGSEAYRTTTGANALLSLSSLPIRDTVRNFDKFTKSLVGSLYEYNMEFGPEGDKGDFQVIVRGATSLIARQMRQNSLDWLSQGLAPDERVYIKKRKLVEEKLRVRDLDPAEYMEDQKTVDAMLAQEQEKATEAARLQNQQLEADIKATMSKSFKDVATAGKMNNEANVATFQAIIDALQGVLDDKGTEPAKAAGSKQGG
jgi:hypothetical protein